MYKELKRVILIRIAAAFGGAVVGVHQVGLSPSRLQISQVLSAVEQ